MSKKVVVGMSGGVDSSVVALLLKEQGYDVIGVTMQIFESDDKEKEGCGSLVMVEDAAKVCSVLGIPHYVVDFQDIFKEYVIKYFSEEYKNGRTPNPCIMCNHYVKWEALLSKANELGADYIATGHYGHIIEVDGRYTIHKAKSDTKDQSYVLYRLTQNQLEHTIFPLSGMEKTEVRELAKKADLPVAAKKESQDICFIADHDYAGYIRNKTGFCDKPGNFADKDGNVLGQHKGITNYTVGQRKGFGIAFGEPKFVVRIDAANNEVILGGHDELMSDRIKVADMNYMAIPELTGELEAYCKVRYSQNEMKCVIQPSQDGVEVQFESPVRAPAPGQSAVFYKDGYVLCGGTIV